MPASAPVAATFAANASKLVEPHARLMLKPSGRLPMAVTSAPISANTRGATSYAAPCAQSTTSFMPEKRRADGRVFLQNSIYRPCASVRRSALPRRAESTQVISALIIASMRAVISSGSFAPSPPKNLTPLSGYGLCEALMTTPAAARAVRVR